MFCSHVIPRQICAGWLMFALAFVSTGQGAEMALIEDFDVTWQEGRWQFSNGAEFPGAQGRFERAREAAHAGKWGGRLQFDFTNGGNYVAALLPLTGAPEIAAIRLWIRKPSGNRTLLRYTDQTGQTFQKGFRVLDDQWSDVLINLSGWTGHWGGAKDGIVHGPPKQIAILAENSGRTRGNLFFDDLRWIEGKPGEDHNTTTSEYVAARFDPTEGWRVQGHGGNPGTTQMERRTWHFDFTKGASSLGLIP